MRFLNFFHFVETYIFFAFSRMQTKHCKRKIFSVKYFTFVNILRRNKQHTVSTFLPLGYLYNCMLQKALKPIVVTIIL